jgi:hypothetical protein
MPRLLTDEKDRTIYAKIKINEAIDIALEALYRCAQGHTLAAQIDQPEYTE